ncbi:hypothetical protein [Lutispora sp.]|uniref:hypothetical protein n=1 Tax=Lutispora sp. TaxID=2828727 RepID=UPI0035614CE0
MILFVLINIIILLTLCLIFSNISILVIGLLGLLIVTQTAKKEDSKIYGYMAGIYLAAVFLMLILYYGYMAQYGTPYYLGGSDDLAFEKTAEYILQAGYHLPNELLNEPSLYYHSAKGFLWLLSWLIRFCDIFGGYHTIAYRILNIYFLMTLGIFVYKYFSSKYDFSNKQNLVLLLAVTMFPNAQYISIHVFRDTLNILILFVIFVIWDICSSKEKLSKIMIIKTLSITLILTYVSFWMRAQNLIFIAAIVLLNLFLKNKVLTKRTLSVYLGALLVTLIIFSYLGVFKEIIKFNEYYKDYLLETNQGLSQRIFSMNLLPFGILFRIAFGLVSPLPLGILQFTDMFTDIEAFFKVIVSAGIIIQIYLTPYLLLNIRRIDKVTIVYIMFFLATVVTTFTFRHFIMLYPFMAILIFRQFYKTPKQTKLLLFSGMTIILALSAGAYILIK